MSAARAIVVPAHDEEAVIGAKLSPNCAARQWFRRVVSSPTIAPTTRRQCARSAGAQVVVRDDAERRGKGFALAAARDLLRADPPDVVIVARRRLPHRPRQPGRPVRRCLLFRRACQAINLLAPDLLGPADRADLQLRFHDQEFGQATRPAEACGPCASDRHWHGASVGCLRRRRSWWVEYRRGSRARA